MGYATQNAVGLLLVSLIGACAGEASTHVATEPAEGTAQAGAVAPSAAPPIATIPEAMRPKRLLAELEARALAPNISNGGTALFTDVVTVGAGEDLMFCTYTNFVAQEKLYLHDTKAVQSRFGHHAILQYTLTPQPPGTHECAAGSLEQQQSQIIGGMGEGQNVEYPPNVVSEIPAGAQLMINHHWINTSDVDVEAQAEIVTVPPPAGASDLVIARAFIVQSTSFDLAPHGAGRASVACPIDRDVKLISALGHMHEWGTHIRAERLGSKPDVVFDYDFAPILAIHPKVNYYTLDAPYPLSAGDSMSLACQWSNTTQGSLKFPGEMCVFFAWQVGAAHDSMCFDGTWVQ